MTIIDMPTDRSAVPTRKQRQEALLQGLRRNTDERTSLLRHELELIDWCRDEGVPWADIADALGVTAEAARLAWHRRARARQAEAATCP